jgi:hypothetical protein
MKTSRIAAAVASTVLALGLAQVGPAHGAAPTTRHVVVVSPHGSDGAAGTAAHPVRTIQVAVRRVASGGVVELRGGVYHQRVRLIGVRHITLRPYQHEHPVLSGAGLAVPDDRSALIEIANSRDVGVLGLELTGYRTTRIESVPIGIYVHGHDRGIHIVGNHVHHLGNDNTTLGSFDINAHGIAVYGDDPHASVTGLSIRGNTVDHLHLGASETVVVNGNVNGWSIIGNNIHDNNNIGIDAIGFEHTLSGKYRYTQLNRARNGIIAGNHIARIVSRGNPAYWEDGEWCNCADGIYIDGGAHILVQANRVSGSDIGIEVAAENARGTADHVLTRYNHVTGSLFTGIATGGYCNGSDDCGAVQTGSSHDNTFEYNTLRGNNRLDDGSPELLVQYHSYRNTFIHNDITATNSEHVVYGTVPNADTAGHPGTNHSDHNRFHAVGATRATVQFGWGGHAYTGFDAYRRATGQDWHSTFS